MNEPQIPLFRTLLDIGALWMAAEAGYRVVLPVLGYSISYNESPMAIAAYYALWTAVSIVAFWDLFKRLSFEKNVWTYVFACLGFGTLAGMALTYLASLGVLDGAAPTYSELLFATPWYFLPKAMEILLQQTLIAVLVLTLSVHFSTLRAVMLAYAVTFGGAHVALFLFGGAPLLNALVLTTGALASTFVFPQLYLRVPSGFVYAYIIHFLYYALVIIVSRSWPPPGYGA